MSGGLRVGRQDFLRELDSTPSLDFSLFKEGRASLIKERKASLVKRGRGVIYKRIVILNVAECGMTSKAA